MLQVLEAIVAQIPPRMDEQLPYTVVEDGHPVQKQLGFADDHKFCICLTVDQLRIIRDHVHLHRSKTATGGHSNPDVCLQVPASDTEASKAFDCP